MNRTIEFLIYPGALGLDIMGPLEVFHTASRIVKDAARKYSYRFVSATRGPVALSSGVELVADAAITDQERSTAHMLLVPG